MNTIDISRCRVYPVLTARTQSVPTLDCEVTLARPSVSTSPCGTVGLALQVIAALMHSQCFVKWLRLKPVLNYPALCSLRLAKSVFSGRRGCGMLPWCRSSTQATSSQCISFRFIPLFFSKLQHISALMNPEVPGKAISVFCLTKRERWCMRLMYHPSPQFPDALAHHARYGFRFIRQLRRYCK